MKKARRILAAALALTLLAAGAPMGKARAASGQVFVAPWGNDASDGSHDAPFQTIDRALDEICDNDMNGATVVFREGRYEFYGAYGFTPAFPEGVTFRAYPGETPVFAGSDRIMGFTETTRFGVPVWEADLPYTELNALYGDDGARVSARYPKEGMLLVERADEEDGTVSTAASLKRFSAFYLSPSQMPFDPTGCRIRLFHWWKDECTTVADYDAASGYVRLTRRTSATVAPGDMFYFENVLNAPMKPGEWAYDAQAQKLYYCPREGETIENTPLYAGVLGTLFTAIGVKDLAFEGITFAQTGWSYTNGNAEPDFPQAAVDADTMMQFVSCDGVSFIDCVFRDTGGGCIYFGTEVKNGVVRGCDFRDVGAQAVYIEGRNLSDDARANMGFAIENNLIDGYGRVFMNAPAILIIHARHGEIKNNTIRDGFYTGISAGWVWGNGYSATDYWHISGNLIENIGQGLLSDLGGVYLLGRQKNTVIEGNVIRDVTHAENGYGGRAIFLDEGADGVTVRRNLCYRCSSQAYFQHNAGDNTLIENVFAYCAEGQVGLSDNAKEGDIVMERNVLVGGEPYVVTVGSAKEGALGDYREHENTKGKVSQTGTLFYDSAAGFAPFVNPLLGDYSLVIDEALLQAGFLGFAPQAGCTRTEDSDGFAAALPEETLPVTSAPQAALTPAPEPTATTVPMPVPTVSPSPHPDTELQVDSWSF